VTIQLLKGEADTLYALRHMRGQWVDAKTVTLHMYPGNSTKQYCHRTRMRMNTLESFGFVETKQPPNNAARLFRVTDSGMFTPFDVVINQHSKTVAAALMRRESLEAHYARKREEQRDESWFEQMPIKSRIWAKDSPRIGQQVLRNASVFAWAGQ
jgi:hypothetical protein